MFQANFLDPALSGISFSLKSKDDLHPPTHSSFALQESREGSRTQSQQGGLRWQAAWARGRETTGMLQSGADGAAGTLAHEQRGPGAGRRAPDISLTPPTWAANPSVSLLPQPGRSLRTGAVGLESALSLSRHSRVLLTFSFLTLEPQGECLLIADSPAVHQPNCQALEAVWECCHTAVRRQGIWNRVWIVSLCYCSVLRLTIMLVIYSFSMSNSLSENNKNALENFFGGHIWEAGNVTHLAFLLWKMTEMMNWLGKSCPLIFCISTNSSL